MIRRQIIHFPEIPAVIDDFTGLTITIGCPGSGKSSWADKHLPATTLRLERDRLRECVFGSRRAYHDSPLTHEERSSVITQMMLTAMLEWPHRSAAVTGTSLRPHAVDPFIEIAQNIDAPIRLVIFERDAAYLRTANRIRPIPHRIPDEILEENIALFFDENAWWRHANYETHYAYRFQANAA